ncbi:hypothetical protein HDV05_004983 [Chytridiales sp. JEL 0842]|nr:hypothetical protein HDV05_004983 [Chytridiales sp. JEL 0842]
MSHAVRIQDAFPLTSTHLAATFPKHITITAEGERKEVRKVGRRKSPTASAATTKTTITTTLQQTKFLASVAAEEGITQGETDVAVVTSQADGVYVYNIVNQHCTQSFSVPHNVQFSCGARYISTPKSPSTIKKQTSSTTIPNSTAIDSNNAMDMDLDEPTTIAPDEDENIPSSSSKRSGRVFVAIESAPHVEEKDNGRVIWMWRAEPEVVAENMVPGKPHASKLVDHPVKYLASHAGRLVVVHKNANITLLGTDLVKHHGSLSRPKTQLPSTEEAQVVWAQVVGSGLVSQVLTVFHLGGKYFLRMVKLTTPEAGSETSRTLMSVEVAEKELCLVGAGVKPLTWTFGEEAGALVTLLSSGDIKVFHLSHITETEPLAETISINTSALNLNSIEKPENLNPYSIRLIGKSYIAFVASRSKSSGFVEDVLSVWDIQYGTLQMERVLNTADEPSQSSDPLTLVAADNTRGRFYQLIDANSPTSGPVLLIARSLLKSSTPVSVQSTVLIIPYFCPPLSLMSALGKKSGGLIPPPLGTTSEQEAETKPFATKVDTANGTFEVQHPGLPTVAPVVTAGAEDGEGWKDWIDSLIGLDELDRKYVLRLITPGVVSGSKTFVEVFRKWIVKKAKVMGIPVDKEEGDVAPMEVVKEKTEGPVSTPQESFKLANLPIIEIAQPAMLALLSRCLSSPATFWPSEAIAYLILTGTAPSVISPPGIPTSSTTSISLMKAVLEKNDLPLLDLLLTPTLLPSLTEKDLVLALQHVCCGGATKIAHPPGTRQTEAQRQSHARAVKKLEAIEKFAWGPVGPKGKMFPTGRSYFIHKVFASKKNEYQFAYELKSLGVEDLQVVLEWSSNILTTDGWKSQEGSKNYVHIQRYTKRGKGPESMEWMFETIKPTDADKEMRRQLWWLWEGPMKGQVADQFVVALDALTVLLDSHLSTILLTPSLQTHIPTIKSVLSEDMRVLSLLERKLKGSLAAFYIPGETLGTDMALAEGLTGVQKEKKQREQGKQLRKRWRRMSGTLRRLNREIIRSFSICGMHPRGMQSRGFLERGSNVSRYSAQRRATIVTQVNLVLALAVLHNWIALDNDENLKEENNALYRDYINAEEQRQGSGTAVGAGGGSEEAEGIFDSRRAA